VESWQNMLHSEQVLSALPLCVFRMAHGIHPRCEPSPSLLEDAVRFSPWEPCFFLVLGMMCRCVHQKGRAFREYTCVLSASQAVERTSEKQMYAMVI
jgi:hypothetical protein